MIGAGTFINPILKIITTVVILGAVYIFFVKPALDTTKEITESVSRNVGEAQQVAFGQAQESATALDLSHAKSRAESYSDSLRSTWPAASNEVRGCIKAAGQDAKAAEKCAQFGEDVVHRVQSNRSFARSYATSLDAQGKAAEADEVNACVEDAGFKIGPMQRCRNLADRYLFPG